MMVATERGSGRTTRQILEAPRNAVFVCAGTRSYTDKLCRYLGRGDLVLCAPDALAVFDKIRGTDRVVIVDHAYHEFPLLLPREFAELMQVCERQNQRIADRGAR